MTVSQATTAVNRASELCSSSYQQSLELLLNVRVAKIPVHLLLANYSSSNLKNSDKCDSHFFGLFHRFQRGICTLRNLKNLIKTNLNKPANLELQQSTFSSHVYICTMYIFMFIFGEFSFCIFRYTFFSRLVIRNISMFNFYFAFRF